LGYLGGGLPCRPPLARHLDWDRRLRVWVASDRRPSVGDGSGAHDGAWRVAGALTIAVS
jgi:hypothetical protein